MRAMKHPEIFNYKVYLYGYEIKAVYDLLPLRKNRKTKEYFD